MKRLAAAIGSAALLLTLCGCGGPRMGGGSTPSPHPITWQDGNPLVPACGSATTNCKKDYSVHDRNTDTVTSLPITATSFTPKTADDYEIRANGYDWTGAAISSDYVTLPK